MQKHLQRNKNSGINQHQIDLLHKNIKLEQSGLPGMIALATKESIEFAHLEEIAVCASDSNYTMILFLYGRKKTDSQNFKGI